MKNFVNVFSVAFVSVSILVILAAYFLTRTSSALAWKTSQSAEATCVLNSTADINYVNIKVSFTNEEKDDLKVIATDNWTGQKVDLGIVGENQTKTGLIKTGQKSIDSNSVTFELNGSDNLGKDTIKTTYNALECKQLKSITPTHAPKETQKPTIVPTSAQQQQQTQTQEITINNTNIASATANASVELAVQPTQTPIPTSTPTPTTQGQVLAAKSQIVTVLPETGPHDAILFGIFSLLPAGIYLRNRAKRI